jgi:hypothetical protein
MFSLTRSAPVSKTEVTTLQDSHTAIQLRVTRIALERIREAAAILGPEKKAVDEWASKVSAEQENILQDFSRKYAVGDNIGFKDFYAFGLVPNPREITVIPGHEKEWDLMIEARKAVPDLIPQPEIRLLGRLPSFAELKARKDNLSPQQKLIYKTIIIGVVNLFFPKNKEAAKAFSHLNLSTTLSQIVTAEDIKGPIKKEKLYSSRIVMEQVLGVTNKLSVLKVTNESQVLEVTNEAFTNKNSWPLNKLKALANTSVSS